MARVLDSNLVNVLHRARRFTTLKITLGDSSVLYYSTAEVSVNSINYLPKLAPVDALNLEATGADEGIELKISNVDLTLGQNLINTPNILDGAEADLGCYFEDLQTGNKWHDEKLPGMIETEDIDDEWISVFFTSLGAKKYTGHTVADLFPEAEVPVEEIPEPPTNFPPIQDDPFFAGPGPGRIREPIDGLQGRYLLPFELGGQY